MIRRVTQDDAESICDIYNYHVENTIVTFEEQPVSIKQMRDRIEQCTSVFPWLVLLEDQKVIGYTYASPWKSRCSYRYSAECTIYIAENYTGRGFGTQLYKGLIEELHLYPVHCILAGISLPNPPSVALHEKIGFEKIAHFKQVGWKFDQWIDVGYWELILVGTA
jgi:L-amino acid N-acyltransferase YncA